MSDPSPIITVVRALSAEVHRIVNDKAIAREDKVVALETLWKRCSRVERSAYLEIMFLNLAGLCLPVGDA
jgi:hypothetical protein